MESGGAVNALSAPKILIIEDDAAVGQTLVTALQRSGMETVWVKTGAEALEMKRRFSPDVALLDLNLPDAQGMGLVKHLAQDGACGVIIVSGVTDETDRIVGLEIGADDYVAKPPHLRELMARIRAVHRRVKLRNAKTASPAPRTIVTFGRFKVDLAKRLVQSVDGERIALTGAEFIALELMVAANGEAVSRDRLCRAALHRPWNPEDRSVDQLIFSLRRKLGDSDEDRVVHSIRGQGYMLSVDLTDAPAP
jgi:two-component system torCAD operon response regulator TorR